ncbi:hypothetical protein FB45DRAFT_916816 [Roridomyces roridus]|uniref:F-box domain-containing protein n=1 Tax=Roridomyces roridus TaxID=1738132 RepID=A0AAD7FPD7_9AGAR|nr:hypothetical protein FB45DRAFT_916816 [Roridomyces roridus]
MATTTTLQSLPQELTIQIFQNLIADAAESDEDYVEPMPLLLSRVSRFFRQLMLNSPTLWTFIRVHSPADRDAAPMFISLSKSCLLNVSFSLDTLPILAPAFIQSCAPSRWASLVARGSWNEIAAFLRALDTSPDLKDVRLLTRSRSFDFRDHHEDHEPHLAGASTALTSLTIHGCIRCLAPFPNLTKLNVHRLLCDYDQFRDLLQASPGLETLILCDLLDRLDGHDDCVVGDNGPPILKYLSAPNIEYLELRGSRMDYGEFSGKEFAALRVLCLCEMIFPTCDAAVYRSFSKITHLELNNVQGGEQLVARDEAGALPFPNLETVVGRWLDEEDCSWLRPLLDGRPRVVLRVQRKDDVLAFAGDHDVQVLSHGPWGLIHSEFLSYDEEEDDDFSGSDHERYSDEVDFFEEMYEENYEYELEHELEEEDFHGDDDDGDWGFDWGF